mgnify:CR=1 FL=1
MPWPEITPARLEWRDGVPASADYGDIYFDVTDGLAQARQVFVGGIGAPDIWHGAKRFTVGEVGFGAGLNFLATWRRWRETADDDARLHYLAVEAHPLTSVDVSRALGPFRDLLAEAAVLSALWPEPHPGPHRRVLDGGRVTLTVVLADAAAGLAATDAAVDAWFLDGFAPDRNPAMWNEAVLDEVARLSAPGARLATYSVAGAVRRGLADRGFRVDKVKGDGPKGEHLMGRYEGTPGAAALPAHAARPDPVAPGTPCAVVGAGVAGAAAARALANHGLDPILLEAGNGPAAGASGNPCGLVDPRLDLEPSTGGRLHAAAYLDAVHRLDMLATQGWPVWAGPRGLLRVPPDSRQAARFDRLADSAVLPPGHVERVTAADAREHANVEAAGLWLPRAGAIRPRAVVAALAHGLPQRPRTPVAGLMRGASGWLLLDPRGHAFLQVPLVVLAAGCLTPRLWPDAGLPVTPRRGQISRLDGGPGTPDAAVTFGGYLTPAVADYPEGDERHVLGATYDRWPDPTDRAWATLSDADHDRLFHGLSERLPRVAAAWEGPGHDGRVGLRATLPDRMPVAGPLDEGLHALTGLGSHGFQTGPLLAELLAAYLTGAPLPLPADVAAAVHPARFG